VTLKLTVTTVVILEKFIMGAGHELWKLKCWRSRFDSNNRKIRHVDCVPDAGVITEHFASHFENVYTNGSDLGAQD